MKKIFSLVCLALLSTALFTACSSDSDDPAPEVNTVDSAVLQQQFEKNYYTIEDATFKTGSLPTSTTTATIGDVNINSQALTGGSNFITIQSEEIFNRFYVGVEGKDGYLEIVPSVTNSGGAAPTRAGGIITYIIAIIYGESFTHDIVMLIKGRRSDGSITAAYRSAVNVVESMEGDLHVNLTFSNEKDIDLHLISPSGHEFYFGNRTVTVYDDNYNLVAEYGLDHDSNAACYIDSLNNENIVIPEEYIEGGIYHVYVNMWSNCNTSIATNWQVAVRYKGRLVSNLMGQRTDAENDAATDNYTTTVTGRNPVLGEYPIGAWNGDKTEVMQFKIKEASAAAPAFRMVRTYKPTLLDQIKMEEPTGLHR